MTALLFWHSANGAGQVAGGPGSGCFLDGAVGHPALFSPDAVSVLAVVGGLLRIGLGISTFGRCDFLAFDRFNFSQ